MRVVPLSASELVNAEREAVGHIRDGHTRGRPSTVEKWSTLFLRLLELHRATERQSTLLQEQVGTLQREVERLEAVR